MSRFVGNPEDRFSRDAAIYRAHLKTFILNQLDPPQQQDNIIRLLYILALLWSMFFSKLNTLNIKIYV